jgi:hypothetical protein
MRHYAARVRLRNAGYSKSAVHVYDFEPMGGEHTQWQLDHAGVNQWNFATPLKDSAGTTQAVMLALLSFTSDGYKVTQVAPMSTGEVVKCPTVDFHRLQP